MGYVDTAARRFSSELSLFVNRWVAVKTTAGREYEGVLLGYTLPELSLVLSDARDKEGHKYPKVVISGRVISEVILLEEPLDMEELANRLKRYFTERAVKYFPEARLIVVMERVRVTERGVEGGGPVAERVKAIYDEFVREWEEKKRKVS